MIPAARASLRVQQELRSLLQWVRAEKKAAWTHHPRNTGRYYVLGMVEQEIRRRIDAQKGRDD